MKISQIWLTNNAIEYGILPKHTPKLNELVFNADINVMKTSQFRPKRKAIALAFIPKMTLIEVD